MTVIDPANMHGAECYVVRFGNRIPKEGIAKIKEAYKLSKEIHRNDFRGDGVTRYFEHCRDLANFISVELGIKDDWEMNVVPWIHDAPEDHKDILSLLMIKDRFGYNVYHITCLMTKGEEYKKDKSSYIRNLREAESIEALIQKLGDRIVNLRTLGMKDDPKFQIKQINETINDYLPLADFLISLISKSEKWGKKVYIGIHIKTAIENQILSFRAEYGDKIILLTK